MPSFIMDTVKSDPGRFDGISSYPFHYSAKDWSDTEYNESIGNSLDYCGNEHHGPRNQQHRQPTQSAPTRPVNQDAELLQIALSRLIQSTALQIRGASHHQPPKHLYAIIEWRWNVDIRSLLVTKSSRPWASNEEDLTRCPALLWTSSRTMLDDVPNGTISQ